ncbi:MAG: hypothetical protein CVU77_04955 [Elusimicrobia bacterium HGW-Elusimicrobia-1]|jgi:peroxiredoxin family protein|nr:MAG: hypothetical protein CVU77_04955 [Elusimicrobia bacterium HGW-Elusimicrobia-1]
MNAEAARPKITLILFSGELDKAIACFTLAATAAAGGFDVTIFFTFWGLNVIKKKRFAVGKSQNLFQKLFNLMSTSRLPLSKLNFFGAGPVMMKILMKKTGAARLDDLIKTARDLKVKFIACTTSCGVMGLGKDELSGDVDEFAGAATYLAEAKGAGINLFI